MVFAGKNDAEKVKIENPVYMKTFVIMGCGRLAGIVSDAVVKGLLPEYELVGVYSRTTAKSERIAAQMQRAGKACAVCLSTEELLALKPDVLVETASPAALREVALPALEAGISVVTLSIGALADEGFYRAVSAAARESDKVNPEKASSASQFYIAYGRRFNDQMLDDAQKQLDRQTGGTVKLTQGIREVYKKQGGTPHLDGQYTVFGEVVEGLDVVNSIQWVDTDENGRPKDDIKIIRATVVK